MQLRRRWAPEAEWGRAPCDRRGAGPEKRSGAGPRATAEGLGPQKPSGARPRATAEGPGPRSRVGSAPESEWGRALCDRCGAGPRKQFQVRCSGRRRRSVLRLLRWLRRSCGTQNFSRVCRVFKSGESNPTQPNPPLLPRPPNPTRGGARRAGTPTPPQGSGTTHPRGPRARQKSGGGPRRRASLPQSAGPPTTPPLRRASLGLLPPPPSRLTRGTAASLPPPARGSSWVRTACMAGRYASSSGQPSSAPRAACEPQHRPSNQIKSNPPLPPPYISHTSPNTPPPPNLPPYL